MNGYELQMEEIRIQQMLDLLAEMQAQRQLVELDRQAAIDKIFTPEIKAQIADIEVEFNGKTEAVMANIIETESQIKKWVLALSTTIKGAHLQAVWTRPRVSWDTRALDGYAAGHPEIEKFRKVGEPSVSIRQVGQ